MHFTGKITLRTMQATVKIAYKNALHNVRYLTSIAVLWGIQLATQQSWFESQTCHAIGQQP